MDPITLTLIIAGIASAVAVAKKRKRTADEAAKNVAARMGAEAGAEVLEQAPPDATAAQQKAIAQKAIKTAAKVALKALPIVAAVAAVVLIVKKVKAARQARSAALREYWPLLTWATQADWLGKKFRARQKRRSISRARTLRRAEKAAVAGAVALAAKGDEAVRARVRENMKNPKWHDTQPGGYRPAPVYTTWPSYQTKEKAKQIKLMEEAATEAAKATLVQAESVAGLSLL